jgi:hypothetical protein
MKLQPRSKSTGVCASLLIPERVGRSSSAVDRSVLAEAGVGDPQAYLQARREVLTQALQTATTPTERVAFEVRLKHLERQGFGVVPLFVGLWSP